MKPYEEAHLYTFTLNFATTSPEDARQTAERVCAILNDATRCGFDRSTGIPPAVMGETAGFEERA